jgi:hypothetical protein
MKPFRTALVLAFVMALAFPVVAFAAGPAAADEDGRVVVGGTYTLPKGQTLSGDLVVIGASATTEVESEVQGNVALIGGFLNADGTIDGDVFGMGGIITLGPTAVVHGNLVTLGAVVNKADGAVVEGQISQQDWSGLSVSGPDIVVPSGPGIVIPRFTDGFEVPGLSRGGFDLFNPLFTFGWSLLRALLMAGLAVLVVMFWPQRTARVSRALIAQPAASGGIGLLTAFLAAMVIIVLAFTICLIPFSFLGGVVLAAAFVFGWIALGLEVGVRLAEVFKRTWHPATQAGLGTLLLTFVAYAFNLIPCCGFIVPLVLSLIGLGAVTLTRFGGQEYPGEPAKAIEST